MRLRNKNTGEITQDGDWDFVGLVLKLNHTDDSIEMDDRIEYHSLAELNDEWEDYTPAEPLIEDERVRKAVRAWADALDLRWFKRCGSVNAHTSRLYGQDAIGTGYTMELGPDDLYGVSISKKGYSLAELCGEEEE